MDRQYRVGHSDEAFLLSQSGLAAITLDVDDTFRAGTYLLTVKLENETACKVFEAEGKVFTGLISLCGQRMPPKLIMVSGTLHTTVEEMRNSSFVFLRATPSDEVSEQVRGIRFNY